MRILAVGAHPDDLEILCAGTLAKYVQRGDYVAMAISTNGEVGSSTLPKSHASESQRRGFLPPSSVLWDAEGDRYGYHAAFAPHVLRHNDPEVTEAVFHALRSSRSLRFWCHEVGRTALVS